MIDLRKFSAGPVTKLPLYGRRAMQNANQDPITGDWIAVQPSGHDTRVSRIVGGKRQQQILVGAGHNSQTAVINVGGVTHVVVDWDGDLLAVPFVPSATPTTKAKSKGYRFAPGKDAGYVLASINHHAGLLVLRRKSGSGSSSQQWFTCWQYIGGRIGAQVGKVIGPLKAESPTYQGHFALDDPDGGDPILVRPTGYGRKVGGQRAYVHSFTTGKALYDRDIRLHSNSAWPVQEPEGGGADLNGVPYFGYTLHDKADEYHWQITRMIPTKTEAPVAETTYPLADARTQWLPKFGGVTMPRIEKLVLHSTESPGWPGYPNFAPTFTYNPWTHQWRQHLPVNRSASTLADSSSTAVRENRDGVVQVEIVGYADQKTGDRSRWITNMDEAAKRDLAAFIVWLHVKHGMSLAWAPNWPAYPSSYGNRQGQRMTGPQFDAFKGVCGHMHVPSNDHGDPGNIDVAGIQKYVKALTAAAPKPPTTTPEAPAPITGGPIGMTDIYYRAPKDQPIKSGVRVLDVKDDGSQSVVIGSNKGVDVSAVVNLKGLPAGKVAWLYFRAVERVVTKGRDGKDVVTVNTLHSRRGTSVIGAGGATVGLAARWAGPLPAVKTKGASPRLRLVLSVPQVDGKDVTVTVTDVEVTGWKL